MPSWSRHPVNQRVSRITLAGLCCVSFLGCSGESDPEVTLAAQLQTAESMIDAFYSFDAEVLRPMLANAGEAQGRILGYQGWAEGGNYIVLDRAPCARADNNKIDCAITVQDDPVVALETGFHVTDTFHLTFEGSEIVNVETSSNDQPIYYEARKWVEENLPEVMEGPCRRVDGLRVTPGDCARAMTDGYAQFLKAKKAAEAAGNDSVFVPDDFEVPRLVETESFKLVPLGPELVDIDYAAYMSSIQHLQATFTRSTDWPHADIDDEAAMQDMVNEQGRFERRESFAYGVITPEGDRERGCIYVRPSRKPGYDAEVSLWVTKAEFDEGFDASLYEWAQVWIEESWPFAAVAFPGRAISWEEWDAI